MNVINLDTIRDAIAALYPPLNKKKHRNPHALGVEASTKEEDGLLFVVLKGKTRAMRFRAELTLHIDGKGDERSLVLDPDLPVAQCHAQALALRLAKELSLGGRPVSERRPDGKGFLTRLPFAADAPRAQRAEARAARIKTLQERLKKRTAAAPVDEQAARAKRQAQRAARAKARHAGLLQPAKPSAPAKRDNKSIVPSGSTPTA